MKHITLFLYLFLLAFIASGQNATTKIYYFTIDDNISKPALRKTEKALQGAEEENADILLLQLNTFGGELGAAEQIRTLLLDASLPVYVFIDPNAASAGALISLACDSIYMSPGASIGAASVVDQTGDILPDKYQSYMRSMMRATAEKQGRDPMIAQAMVDPDVAIPGIIDSGKVLTFTTKEAIRYGFCEGEANSVEEVLGLAGIDDYQITEQKLSWIDKVISFLIHPAVSGILIMLIIGGIYFELQTPGIGFPFIIAVTAALLYFMPHYLEGLAAHWEILLFLIGLALLIIELFVIPGFGIVGITGIALMVTALVMAMIFNIGFDFRFVPPHTLSITILIVLTALILGFLLSLWLGKKFLTVETRFGSLSLKTQLKPEEGYIAADFRMNGLIGETGVTLTFMRPSGKVEIKGDIYDAVSAEGMIDKEQPVKVIRFENAQLVVEKSDQP